MDVTNQQIPSLRGMANNYQTLKGQHNVLKQSHLRKNLTQLRQNISANSARSSFEATTRIALAESYISKGNFFAAEQIIKEVSDMAFSYLQNVKDDSYEHSEKLKVTDEKVESDQEVAEAQPEEELSEAQALKTIKNHIEEEVKNHELSNDLYHPDSEKNKTNNVQGLGLEVQNILTELKNSMSQSLKS